MGNKKHDKTQIILQMFSEGYGCKEIAEKIGYKNSKQISCYMRRKGYRWDEKNNTYLAENEEHLDQSIKISSESSKADSMVVDFNNGSDLKIIVEKYGFENNLELGNYLRRNGYSWDNQAGTYVLDKQEPGSAFEKKQVVTTSSPEGKLDQASQERQVNNEKRFREIKADDSSHIRKLPRYVIPGHTILKTMGITVRLNELIRAYAREYNLSQKEIFTIALIGFFEKYGYKDKLDFTL